jgi:hypothetical protein
VTEKRIPPTSPGAAWKGIRLKQKPSEERDQYEREESEKNVTRETRPVLDQDQARIYKEVLRTLNEARIDYAVGAAFARYAYTSIWRYTKDLDIFLRPEDLKCAMEALRLNGFETTIKEEHWLAKAWKERYFVDLIFGTGHGQLPVDEDTFRGAKRARLLGVQTSLLSIEEMLASSMYIAGRNRFDGPEIVHLIRSVKGKVDWQRVLHRLGGNSELLLWHLILFDFIYPGHSSYLPKRLMSNLFEDVRKRWSKRKRDERVFRGTLLDPFSYNVDIADWGYEDQRNTNPLVNEAGEAL